MPDNDIQITPRKAPLTGVSTNLPAKKKSQSRPEVMFVIIGVLIGIAYWVIFVLPESINTPELMPASQTSVQVESAEAINKIPELTAPYQQLEKQRAQKEAQAALRSFVDLQLELDSMAVVAWGAKAFAAAKEYAASGDKKFVEQEFVGAADDYSLGAEKLQSLLALGQVTYQAAIADGLTALALFDATTAESKFQKALSIFATGAEALDGLNRAEILPEILLLMSGAKKQIETEDYTQALDQYQQVAALDPAYPGIQRVIENTSQQLLEQQFSDHLSAGFQALDRNRISRARNSFRAAGKLKPGNSLVLGAMQQVEQRSELQTIEKLRQQAIQHLAVDEYSAAVTTYESVLAIDSALQFAKQGIAHARTLNRLATGLQAILSDPGRLSSNERFDEAKKFQSQGQKLAEPGSKLAALVVQVSATLEFYSLPITVEVISDGATEVVIHKVGRLGKFESKTLSLRPGFYTIVGSRDGCRDELKEVHVLPDMKPIDVRCRETI